MRQSGKTAWAALVGANVLCWCVLSFYRTTEAAPQERESFANAIEQRMEMIRELKEINQSLKEQNALLRSGKLQVLVTEGRGKGK